MYYVADTHIYPSPDRTQCKSLSYIIDVTVTATIFAQSQHLCHNRYHHSRASRVLHSLENYESVA